MVEDMDAASTDHDPASGMPSRRRTRLGPVKSLALVVLVPVLIMAVLVVSLQRRIFFPLRIDEASVPAKGWTATDTGGGIHAWTSSWSLGRRTAVMFHGNAVTLGSMAFVADAWVSDGWNVVLVEFPGYDGNPGSPTEASLKAAAIASWDWALANGSTAAGSVVVANSIGTGPAAALVGLKDPAGFLVVSGVDDMAGVVRSQVPFVPFFLVFDRMMSADAIRGRSAPTRVWHAEDDVVVPASQGRAIARAAGTAVVERTGGHQLFWDPALQTELRAEADAMVP